MRAFYPILLAFSAVGLSYCPALGPALAPHWQWRRSVLEGDDVRLKRE